MIRIPNTYRVSYDLKYGIKQHLEKHEVEVDALNQREAIRIVREEAERIHRKHAFHCKIIAIVERNGLK